MNHAQIDTILSALLGLGMFALTLAAISAWGPM